MSDSHGQAGRAAAAVRLLRALGAEALAHCGDVGGENVLAELAGDVPVRFVWGNTDDAEPGLVRYAESLGLTPPGGAPALWELAGRRLAIFHGHEPRFERLLRALDAGEHEAARAIVGEAQYVLYGHTHQAADQRRGGVRLINPGALQRARTYTVATVDLAADEVAHWVVPTDGAAAPQRHRV